MGCAPSAVPTADPNGAVILQDWQLGGRDAEAATADEVAENWDALRRRMVEDHVERATALHDRYAMPVIRTAENAMI